VPQNRRPRNSRVRRRDAVAAVVVTLLGGALALAQAPGASRLPALADSEFWRLIQEVSEPGGGFHSDNFTSNEPYIAHTVAALEKAGLRGGAYLGVGPEQNFTYIAAIEPDIAFVVDIRRQALLQHLLFKALFELSSDRADFIAALFSVPRPEGTTRDEAIDTLWARFSIAPGTARPVFEANLARVIAHLTRTHAFPLSPEEIAALTYVYEAFFKLGPQINYAGFVARGLTTGNTDFQKLTSATDAAGRHRSFLATDAAFQGVRSLHLRNLIVPVEGDFGGPKTLRAIGAYLRERGLRVTAFYISNVEQYLFNPRSPRAPGGMETNGGWRAFYDNLVALPADRRTVLIRVPTAAPGSAPRTLPDGTPIVMPPRREPLCPMLQFLAAVDQGRVTNLGNATNCGA
jgi:hypothetical protein